MLSDDQRKLINYWRYDAFQAAADIVKRYRASTPNADDIIQDIRNLIDEDFTAQPAPTDPEIAEIEKRQEIRNSKPQSGYWTHGESEQLYRDCATLLRRLKSQPAPTDAVNMEIGGVAWQLARFARLFNDVPRSDTIIQNGPDSWVHEAQQTLARLGVDQKWLGQPAPPTEAQTLTGDEFADLATAQITPQKPTASIERAAELMKTLPDKYATEAQPALVDRDALEALLFDQLRKLLTDEYSREQARVFATALIERGLLRPLP